jgi:2'-5' RNA ligase
MRVFVALTLPDDAIVSIEQVQSRLPSGRMTPSDNLHLTLSFLGEIDEAEAEAVHDALSSLAAAPVALTLGGAEIFGGRHGQAVALRADGGEALTTLQSRLLSRLHGAGVPGERRRFRPHVTLARLSGRGDATPLLAVLSGIRLGPFACTGFALIQSRLNPDGAVHETLAAYPLG